MSDVPEAPRYPQHVTARRKERRSMARLSFFLLIGEGSVIAFAGVFDADIAKNIATIWPLLSVIFVTLAAIVGGYFAAGAFENGRIESIVGLAGKFLA